MHIKGITVNNFMRLGMVALQLDGKNLVIGGMNEQGKSSLLNSFWVALGGSEAMEALDITKPIKNGAKDSRIELDLGDLIVRRKWIKNEESGAVNMYLEVVTPEGAKYPSPQKMLDALMGRMFDPFEFSEKKAKEQRELLLKLVDLGTFSLEENAVERKSVFEQRTLVNRDVLTLSKQLEGMPPVEAPDEEESISSILEEQQEAQRQKDANNEERRLFQGLIQDHDTLKTNIGAKEETIAELRRQLAKHEEELAIWRTDMAALMEKGKEQHVKVQALKDPDMEIFTVKLQELEQTNAAVRAKKARQAVQEKLQAVQKESEELTNKLKLLDATKDKALRSAKFPVAGLSIDDDGITFKDVPLGQCSTEEKMRVCIAIAMAMSPKLKVIRISRAESLDPNNFKVITEMAAAGGYQLLMERVGDPGDMGIIIEDGMVKEVAGEA